MATDKPQRFDAIVIGGGPSGLAAALALGRCGIRTALVARRLAYADNRTTALLGPSIDWLDALGVWHDCLPQAAPMRAMRLIDDTGRLIRSPEVTFDAGELGRDAFGYNIENRDLVATLERHLADLAAVTRFDGEARDIVPDEAQVSVTLADGTALQGTIVIGADGRHSPCRSAAGIAVTHRDYPQAALTFNLRHRRPHRDTSTEFHTREGPCVIVPLPGQRSSVVWVMTPARARAMQELDDAALSAAIEQQSHSILGKMDVEPGRFVFPLAVERPSALAARRIALIGEAAHVVPPIGAQGLNLGLRDAKAIVDLVAEGLAAGQDVGADATLRRYRAGRASDIDLRTRMIDAANRTLLSDFLPVQVARATGMELLARLSPLRQAAMRGGLGEGLFGARKPARSA